MELTELGQLVTLIAMGDNRAVDTTVLLYWEKILPEWISYALAERAVIEHRRTSTEYLDPVHVIAISESLMERMPQPAIEPPPVDAAGCISLDAYIRRHPEDRAILKRIYRRKPGRFLDDTGAGDL